MQRRTPLRSSTTLARRTRLDRAGELKRSSELRRAAPMDARRRDTGPRRAVRELVHARSGGLCEATGCRARAEHVHHRRPRRLGGSKRADTNRPSNLLHLCPDHHAAVESFRRRALALGLLLRDGTDPVDEPLLRRGVWVLLTDDGKVTTLPARPPCCRCTDPRECLRPDDADHCIDSLCSVCLHGCPRPDDPAAPPCCLEAAPTPPERTAA